LPLDLTALALAAVAAFSAGAVNAIAGGGTLLTFPALLAVMPAVTANATSAVALVPGSLAAAWGFRRELPSLGFWLRALLVPSFIGGLAGALLLTRLPSSVFSSLVPWLILGATLLLALQPLLQRYVRGEDLGQPPHPGALLTIVAIQLLVATYGGYFGAGAGIMMLGAMGLMHIGDIHAMNALKACLGSAINAVALTIFAQQGVVDWRYAGTMAVAAIGGGYLGARLSQRLNKSLVRSGVVVIGFGLAVYFYVRN